ncbi:MAG: hypothetical protein JWL91_1047 [Sphingomonas bacterium]|jgi:uncharacterized protein|nr:MTH938/NDUFAF3 family protein [Sphingomonas bacterium]MDB5689171.1 hypothetical protein [Sphingomonas bacterium]
MSARLDRDAAAPGPIITGFSGTGFRIGDHVFPDGLILTPEEARPWAAPTLEALEAGALADLLALDPAPEFLLLGTGATMRRPSSILVAALDARGIGIEPMDSRAAARAWGLLRAEGRWIVAALLPLG